MKEVKSEISFLGIDKMNEFQLSVLYLSANIWYGVTCSYADFVAIKTTEYEAYIYIHSVAARYYGLFLDKFRRPNKSVITAIISQK